ncbi:hypothetical protein MTO96_039416 [Rhipicephalus appendiculatus]
MKSGSSLQDGGDAAKELLLEEQDGDAKGGKEFLRWCHSAWNEVPIRKNIRHDMRPYILGVAISVNTVLRLLAPLASLEECERLQAILTFIGNFTMAVLCPAAFSYATQFLSLLAAKASVVKKVELNVLLFGLLGTNAVILVAGCFAGIYGVVTGLATDVMATFHTFRLHWRETEEARTAFLKRWLHPLKPVLLTALVIVVCFIVIIGTIVILVVFGVIPDPAAQAATRGI